MDGIPRALHGRLAELRDRIQALIDSPAKYLDPLRATDPHSGEPIGHVYARLLESLRQDFSLGVDTSELPPARRWSIGRGFLDREQLNALVADMEHALQALHR